MLLEGIIRKGDKKGRWVDGESARSEDKGMGVKICAGEQRPSTEAHQ